MTWTSDYGAHRACLKGLGASGLKGHEPNYYSILFYHPDNVWYGKKILKLLICADSSSFLLPCPTEAQIAPSAPYSPTPSTYVLPSKMTDQVAQPYTTGNMYFNLSIFRIKQGDQDSGPNCSRHPPPHSICLFLQTLIC